LLPASSAQQSITGRMRDDVAVGMTVRSHIVVKEQTCNVHRPARNQPMNVDADSGATRGCCL
jgi:hypothetical protein